MKDKYSNDRIEKLNPYSNVREIFEEFINDCENQKNITIRIMEPVFRSIDEQNELYAQGRTGPGNIVTHAKGGQSFHNYGLAIDICVIKNNGSVDWDYDMQPLSEIAKKYDLEWGGNWETIKDYPHFELRRGFKENCSDIILLPRDENSYTIFND